MQVKKAIDKFSWRVISNAFIQSERKFYLFEKYIMLNRSRIYLIFFVQKDFYFFFFAFFFYKSYILVLTANLF